MAFASRLSRAPPAAARHGASAPYGARFRPRSRGDPLLAPLATLAMALLCAAYAAAVLIWAARALF
jgi:hypothetical protein